MLTTENVDNLGIVGDVVDVRPGYARNFLLPRGLAGQPTPGAIKRLAERRAQVEAEMKARRAVLEGMLEKMAGHEITLMRSANEQGVLFGGISQHDITEAMLADGFVIEDRMVRIGQQIKRLDSYQHPHCSGVGFEDRDQAVGGVGQAVGEPGGREGPREQGQAG